MKVQMTIEFDVSDELAEQDTKKMLISAIDNVMLDQGECFIGQLDEKELWLHEIKLIEDKQNELELVQLAQRFWREIDSPNEEDMEMVFFSLVKRDKQRLQHFLDVHDFTQLVLQLDGEEDHSGKTAEQIGEEIKKFAEGRYKEELKSWIEETDLSEWANEFLREIGF